MDRSFSISFSFDSEENLKKAVADYFNYECHGEPKRYIILEPITYSSEGNEYIYAGHDFDHDPTWDDLIAAATKEFEEYFLNCTIMQDDPEFDIKKEEAVIRLINEMIIVDTYKIP